MKTSETTTKIASAMSKAQGEFSGAEKKSTNPYFSSKYADLASVMASVRPIFAKYGLSIWQCPFWADGRVGMITRIVHDSGEFFESEMTARPAKDDAQAIGSCQTYLRRYGIIAMCGLESIDDDGNAASGNDTKPAQVVDKDKIALEKRQDSCAEAFASIGYSLEQLEKEIGIKKRAWLNEDIDRLKELFKELTDKKQQ